MYCWGRNQHGQLGRGASGSTVGYWDSLPAPVAFAEPFTRMAVGEHEFTCGLTMAGALVCWGHNDFSQLGRGTISDAEPDIVSVAGNLVFSDMNEEGGITHSCGIATGGQVHCWGYGPLGSDVTRSSVPIPVNGGLSFDAVSSGWTHACGMGRDGFVYCWGGGGGLVGNGSLDPSRSPTRVAFQRPRPVP